MAELSVEQLQTLKQRLLERYNHLRRDIYHELQKIGREEDFKDLAGEVHDPGDASVADMIFEADIETLNTQALELRRVEAALKRMAEGHYGECIDCGDDIGYARLEAEPDALRCITCQERYEKQQPVRPTTL